MLNGRHDTCQSLWKQDYTRSTFSSSIGEGLYTLARFHSVWKSLTMLHLGFSIFKNSPKWSIFGIFYELLSVQNVNLLSCSQWWMRLFLGFSNAVRFLAHSPLPGILCPNSNRNSLRLNEEKIASFASVTTQTSKRT